MSKTYFKRFGPQLVTFSKQKTYNKQVDYQLRHGVAQNKVHEQKMMKR